MFELTALISSSLQECRTTRTIARSFVPEFNHSIDFPVPLMWNNHQNQTVSLAEMLEHGELKIDLYHQMNSSEESNDRRPIDIHLCYCTISLRELILRHTGRVLKKMFLALLIVTTNLGIKGWYPLASAHQQHAGADLSEHYVGGLELFARFGQQDDRRRVIDSAKTLGWLDDDYLDEENFLDGQFESRRFLIGEFFV